MEWAFAYTYMHKHIYTHICVYIYVIANGSEEFKTHEISALCKSL